MSSVECKKVVSDILAETEFLADIKSAGKMTHFSYSAGLNSKYLYFYGTNKTSKKNNEIQRKSEHKIASPAKWRKCTYDLLAFNRRCVPECPIIGQLYCVLIEADFEKQKLLKVFVVK